MTWINGYLQDLWKEIHPRARRSQFELFWLKVFALSVVLFVAAPFLSSLSGIYLVPHLLTQHPSTLLLVCAAGAICGLLIECRNKSPLNELEWAINKYHRVQDDSVVSVKRAKATVYGLLVFALTLLFWACGLIELLGVALTSCCVTAAKYVTSDKPDDLRHYIDSMLCEYQPVNAQEFEYLQTTLRQHYSLPSDRLVDWLTKEKKSVSDQLERRLSHSKRSDNFKLKFVDRDLHNK